MQNKKLLFLIQTLAEGGGERVISELTLNFPENIQRVIVLFEEKVSYSYNGKLVSLNVSLSQKLFPKIYYLLVGFLRFRKIVRKEKPDFVISIGRATNIFNILSSAKSIIRVDSSLIDNRRNFWDDIYIFLAKILFKRAEKIIVVSEGLKNEVIKNLRIKKEKIKLIYNPLDIKKIQSLSKEPLESRHQRIFKHPVIINMGRLTEQKGQHYLIRAFKEIKKRIWDLKLVILGEGESKSHLKELIQQLDLENDVYLLDWQKNPFKFLSKSKLFVSSSLSEGLGLAILEAMACGLPVISLDCKSGPREILAPNTDTESRVRDIEQVEYGILVPPKDEKILSKAMIETLNNENLLNNLALKSEIRAKDFNISKIIKEWRFLKA